MRLSFILAIIFFVCSLVFTNPVTDNAGSMILFLCAVFFAFVGVITKCEEVESA